jgi:pimeloyl-ACP methyl ester carboxylesterase
MAVVRQRYAWSRTGEGLEALETAERTARKQPWYPYIGAFGGKANPFWDFWKLIRDYDPAPALQKVRCPVLATFGERDTFVPVAKSVAIWEVELNKAGNKDVTIKVFPNGDHSLVETRTGGLKEIPHIRRFVPGYWDFQLDWLLKRVTLRD